MKMFFMCPLGGLMQKSIISIIAFLKRYEVYKLD